MARGAKSPRLVAAANIVAACLPPDNVRILDATEPGPLLHREMDHQLNNIPNTAALEIVPQQVVDPHSDVVGDGGTTISVQPGVQQGVDPSHSGIIGHNTAPVQSDVLEFNPAAKPVLPSLESHPSDADGVSVPDVAGIKPGWHQVLHQDLGGDDSNVDGAQSAPPSCYLSFSSHFRPYTRSDQILVFFLSTVVAFIALVIQFELGPEMLHRGTGLMRPGWARHRKGWEREELAG